MAVQIVVIRKVHNEQEVELSVRVNLNETSVAEFRAALYAELDEPQKRIVLDMEKVQTVSSSALGAMLLFQKKAREKGKVLVIGRCHPELRQTLLAIRFDRSIEMEGEEPPDLAR
jgi:anti-anti-sigma factor